MSSSINWSIKSNAFIFVLIANLLVGGCSKQNSGTILGTWQSDAIPSEWGSNRITVIFFGDGRFMGTNDFIGGDKMGWQGTYRCRGGVMLRRIQGRVEEISYRIEGETMHQTVGDENYTFKRLNTELNALTNGIRPSR